ncbi:hypothetical protein [Sandaracinus amylolyticus]|uniref:hypothetical protein n=1 Tax=Sandaracinus amylolyticus TaxID=927083 RepID=UPI001F1A64FC|nr:hypothetical protein [Sandaracinus amylolyticus]
MITPPLRDAIEQLYRVFARYPRPPAVRGCPCCVTDADRARLHRAPLRDLTADDLKRYAFKSRAVLIPFLESLTYQRTLDVWTSTETSDAITRWLASRPAVIERAIDEADPPDRELLRCALEPFRLRAQTL